jgi:hypothetical protein
MKGWSNMNKNQKGIAIAILMLVLAILACGGETTGTAVSTNTPPPEAQEPVTPDRYGVGDVIQVENHTISLNSVEWVGNMLKVNFTIENKGSDEITISSFLLFSARNFEGEKLDQEIFDCSPGLDGSVLAGDRLRGNICYKGADATPIRIYYEATLFGRGAIVWEVDK